MWKIFQKPGMFVVNPDFADAATFARTLATHGFEWVAVKIHQGVEEENRSWLEGHDWAGNMRRAGITFGLWGYLTDNPVAEARLASDLISRYDDPSHSCFYIADAEAEYTSWGGLQIRSSQFVSEFRRLRPGRPAALSSFGAAIWDFSLASVFTYTPWINGNFDFMPQAYFNQAAELEPAHCIEQAISNGWPSNAVHPTVASYTDTLGRLTGNENSYLLRNCRKRFGMSGWSVYNAENMTDEDYLALSRVG